MQTLRVNGYDVADLGRGPPLVCLRGTLGDFRTFAAVMGPLSQKHRVIAVSLRHFFPERWDGNGGNYTNRLVEKASALQWKMEHAEIASDPVR